MAQAGGLLSKGRGIACSRCLGPLGFLVWGPGETPSIGRRGSPQYFSNTSFELGGKCPVKRSWGSTTFTCAVWQASSKQYASCISRACRALTWVLDDLLDNRWGYSGYIALWQAWEGEKRFAWGGGRGSFEPPEGGGGSGKGAPVTGQSKEVSLKALMMTQHLRRKAARKKIFSKRKFPHDTYLKTIIASWGIILSHKCWGISEPP